MRLFLSLWFPVKLMPFLLFPNVVILLARTQILEEVKKLDVNLSALLTTHYYPFVHAFSFSSLRD